MIRKIVTITEKQNAFLNSKYIKLSAFIQDKINELMEVEKND